MSRAQAGGTGTSRRVRSARAEAVALIAVAAVAALAGCKGRLETVTLRMGHRMYASFTDTATVRMGERFQIGDTPFTGEVDRFLPDFALDDDKKVVSRSDEIKNPAVHVNVYEGEKVIEESWAFPGRGAPHIKSQNFVYFVITDMKIAPEEGVEGGDNDAAADSAGTGAAH